MERYGFVIHNVKPPESRQENEIEKAATERKKANVTKESTIAAWKMDWIAIGTDSTSGDRLLYCQACRDTPPPPKKWCRGTADSFISGTKTLKKYTAERHQESKAHKTAYEAWKNKREHREPIVQSVLKMNAELNTKMVKLFDIAYHIAKHEKPFQYFSSLISLEKRHGVDLGDTYSNPKQARVFTQFLAEEIQRGITEQVQKARYISILIDGSSDRRASEKEVLYVKYMEKGKPHMRFLGITEPPDASASGILASINSLMDSNGVPQWKEGLVGFGADGASTNFGKKNGIFTKLAADLPWLTGIHCVAHRLELACKDAFKGTYFTEIDDLLSAYASFYQRSPKRVRELEQMAEMLEETIIVPGRVEGTRWLSHRCRALKGLERNYPAVIAHMEEIAGEQSQKIDGAKVRGWLKKITSYRFLLHLALYIDVLQELSHLSLLFQCDAATLTGVRSGIHASMAVLKDMQKNRSHKLRSMQQDCQNGEYKSVKVTGLDIQQTFDKTVLGLIQPVLDCLEERFGEFSTDEVLNAMCVLDPSNWPEEDTSYGEDDVWLLLQHFQDVITPKGCDMDLAMAEWSHLKKIVRRHGVQNGQQLRSRLFEFSWAEEFLNLSHLYEIIEVMPLATAKVERAFSLMNRVKSDWRNQLSTDTLNQLMLISLEGPPEDQVNLQPAVDRWFISGHRAKRPSVLPYGKRQSKSTDLVDMTEEEVGSVK